MTLFRILVQLGLWIAFTTQASDVADTTFDVTAQRARIAAQRAIHESNFSKAQQVCFDRFAVTDCLREARHVRRVAMDELRRQEVILNDLDRQTKAVAEINRIESNVTPERQQELAKERQQALQEAIDRQQRSVEKKSSALRTDLKSKEVDKSDAHGLTSAEITRQQQIYDEKVQQSLQRKADKVKSLNEKDQRLVKPLPLPAQ